MEKNQIEIYRSPDGNIELNIKLENDTVWLTQSQMAELFGRDRTVIVVAFSKSSTVLLPQAVR